MCVCVCGVCVVVCVSVCVGGDCSTEFRQRYHFAEEKMTYLY